MVSMALTLKVQALALKILALTRVLALTTLTCLLIFVNKGYNV